MAKQGGKATVKRGKKQLSERVMQENTGKRGNNTRVHSRPNGKTPKHNYENFKAENKIKFNSFSKTNNVGHSMYNMIYRNVRKETHEISPDYSFDFTDHLLKGHTSSNSSKCSGKTHWKGNITELSAKEEKEKKRKRKYSKEINEDRNYCFPLKEDVDEIEIYPFFRMTSSTSIDTFKSGYTRSYTTGRNMYRSFRRGKTISGKLVGGILVRAKLVRGKSFKTEKKKMPYYRQKRRRNNVYCKKNIYCHTGGDDAIAVPDGEKLYDNNFFVSQNLQKLSSLKCMEALEETNQKGDSLNSIRGGHLQWSDLRESSLRNENHRGSILRGNSREDHTKNIFLSIKRQAERVESLEKMGNRLLDLVELLLYKRMKEVFILKESLCSKDRYREMCPEVFYFNNNDDLIETMDRKFRFLPKTPAKENLVPYCGPSAYEIFGKYYFSYRYFYKLIKVDVKVYRSVDPYNYTNNHLEEYAEVSDFFNLHKDYSMKQNCPSQGRSIRKASKIKQTKKKRNIPFFSSVYISEKKKKERHGYTNVENIPIELIQLLQYKKVTISNRDIRFISFGVNFANSN
ncbi:hypothetical protein, conserved [Plasmodium ovale curtisi]|uniref:Uncharacterized protein n=1 Tax=Plasmodium ovale curtisi TaxID=864141 RepID=A0A1A8W7J4_PLAOA|nr:hypothetical protein, conserved [Plasmodium ovale curtisi]